MTMKTEELYSYFQKSSGVTTDTRSCREGAMFFALRGERFNGNQYALAALESGCAYAVVDDESCFDASNPRLLPVDDSLKALQALARYHRQQLGLPIIGITGTNGKTTTKELIAAVLSRKYRTHFTQGNLNNSIGVPLTLLQLRPEHEIAVVEMGASHPGDIRELVEIAEPDCGIITNVGKAHLEGFGSFEGVIHTKGELYDFLRERKDSVVFIDDGNEHLKGIASGLTLVSYGTTGDTSLCAGGEVVACDPMLRFRWRHGEGEWRDVATHLIGSYNILNMLAAACIGLYFGVTQEQIDHALSNYRPSNNRSQLTITEHNRLIVDTYNANPTSMGAALQNFKAMAVSPKMAILGDMRELGESSEEEHRKVVDFLMENGFDNVWLVGEEFGKTDCPYRKFHDVEEVKTALATQRPEGCYILIKGSNGIRLFELPRLL